MSENLSCRRATRVPLVLAGVVLIVAASGGVASAQEASVVLSVPFPDRPTAGARVFLQKGCGRCHTLTNQPGAAATIGPDLGNLLVSRTVMDLAGAFWNHAPIMREKMQALKMTPPTMTRDDIADIFVLLTAYRYYKVELGQPGNAASGRRVFISKGCAGCHGEDQAPGTRLGPSLQKYGGRSSAIFLAQAMWNHAAEMEEAMRGRSIPWPKFAAREMDDLIAYLQQDAAGGPDQMQYFDSGSPRRGRDIFTDKQCVACHAVHGKGGHGGPDLGTRAGDLVASVATIASLMWNHSPPMAAEFERRGIPRVTFSGQEMVDVIAYLYFVNYTTVRAIPARGARLFADKCATCHSKSGGGHDAPDLTTRARFDDPLTLTAAMWNHGPVMGREVEKRGLGWPRLELGEAADLAAFLLSRPSAAPPRPR